MIGSEFLASPEVRNFIKNHLQSDVQKLLLNPPSEIKDQIKAIANQILARQKARGKLDSWVANPNLIFPPPISIEQASSEKTAIYKKVIVSGKYLVDLSGGMGVDCLTLSENFEQTTYVEIQSEVADVFSYNCEQLGKKINVLSRDSERYIEELNENKADEFVFYVDPARRNSEKRKVFKLEDCTPNILEILPILEKKAGRVLIKLSPLLDIRSVLTEVPHIKEFHVVSVKNECKELLVLIDFSWSSAPVIKAVNLDTEMEQYAFRLQDEKRATAEVAAVSSFLFEPNSSILKAGAFKKIGEDFGLDKVHSNTHLYTSNIAPDDWPGRTFQIVEDSVNKKVIAQYAQNGCINVLTRNYPKGASELKKKYKLKDGGEFFLIGFRDHKEKARLIVAKRLD